MSTQSMDNPTGTTHSRPPFGLKWRSSKTFIVATVAIGLIADLFLYALFVPILPFMIEDRLQIPPDQVQGRVSALLSAYAGASVLVSPLAGYIADQFTRRQTPFLLGLAFLTGATVLLFLARTISLMIVARVLQGISAAFVWTVGLALCLETVGPGDLGKVLGTIFSFISASNLMAPLLGGVLYDKLGLTGVFGVAFALLSVDFVMRLLVVEIKIADRYRSHPCHAPESTEDATTGQDETPTNVVDEPIEEAEDSPLLQDPGKEEQLYKLPANMPKIAQMFPILCCLQNPSLIAALIVGFVQGTLLGSIDATLPIVSQEWYGFSSLHAGLMFIPIGLANLLLGPMLGWCVDRFGTKYMAVLLYTYLVPVLILFRVLGPGSSVIAYGALLALTGIGLAGTGAPSVVEAGTVVYHYHQANPEFFGSNGPYAQLYSLTNCCFSLGLTVGPALAGGLRQTIGYGNMNAVLAIMCAGTAVLSLLFLGGKPRFK